MNFEKKWRNSPLARIYVEEEAKGYPLTEEILARFPGSAVVPIRAYKELFSRKRQNFRLQKKAPQLILAVKKEGFLSPGAKVCERFGHKHFYYGSSVLNCLFDCAYCYLQGVYDSANLVVFVNVEDAFREVSAFLSHDPLYLCISYDTDLLALNGLTGLAERWYDYAQEEPDLTVELRTKSANLGFLRKKNENKAFVLAWTLSPADVIGEYEKGTPPLEKRIAAMREAIDLGYTVRLCLDPLLRIPDFESQYEKLIDRFFSEINGREILDVSVGAFRISAEYLKRLRKNRPACALTLYPFQLRDGVYSYPPEKSAAMLCFVREKLIRYVRESQIYMSDF